jgi:hypothetical protein
MKARRLVFQELDAVCQECWNVIEEKLEKLMPVDIAAAVRTCIESLAATRRLEVLGEQVVQDFSDVFNPIPHVDALPTDVYCEIKLKDASRTIKTRSYSTLASIMTHGKF